MTNNSSIADRQTVNIAADQKPDTWKRYLRAARSRLLPFAGVLVFLLLWQAMSVVPKITFGLLPGPVASLSATLDAILHGHLLRDVGSTLYRTVYAFALGVALGVPVGVALGAAPQVYRASEIIIDLFRSTPATAMFPLFLIIFGLGDFASIAVAAFSAWLVMLLNTAYGVMHAREVRKNAARVMGAKGFRLLKDVLLFDAMAQIFIGLRVAISLALVIIVVAEMFVGARNGIGKRIIDAQIVYDLPLMYGSILLCGIMGYLLNAAIVFTERRFVHWSGK